MTKILENIQENELCSVNSGGTKSEMQCRYCLESGSNKTLLSLCACRGSVRFVHGKCMFRWISYKQKNHQMMNNQIVNCELCKYPIRICIKAPAWFPLILNTKAFWKMLVDLILTIVGMFWYLKELMQLKKGRKRHSLFFHILARGYMNVTCGFIEYLTLDRDFLRMTRRLRPACFFKILLRMVRLLSSVAVVFSWSKYLVTVVSRGISEMNAERLKFATWSFEMTKRD